MLSVSSKKMLLSASSAIAMVALSQAALAQDTTIDDTEVDEIVATGIRASIAKSLDDKRRAQQIIDTINAEDIGKSTDQNIAEALNRISGVSITEQGGEGAFITVRGANADQTVVTLNGVTQGSTEFNQGVNLSSFSADILAKVEVIKTPSADDEEGSLGGLVNLITRKPLELNKDIRTVTAQGRWNSQTLDDSVRNKPLNVEDYKLSGTVSETFFNDTLGIIVNGVRETNSIRQDIFAANDYNSARSFNAVDTDGNVYQSTSGGYTGADAILYGVAPRTLAYSVTNGQRDRTALDAAVQWKPTDTTDINANFNYSLQDIDNVTHSSVVRNNDQSRGPNFNNVGSPYNSQNGLLNGTPTPFQDPADWMVLDPESRTWVRTLRRFETSDINASSNEFENENFTASLDFEQELFGDLTVNVGGSYQKSEQTPKQRTFVNLQSARENSVHLRHFVDPATLEPVGYDCTSGACQPVTGRSFVDLGSVVTEPSAAQVAQLAADGILGTWGQPILTRGHDNFSLSGNNPDDLLAKSPGVLSQILTAVEDETKALYLDADYDLGGKFGISSFEFGGKYTKREKFTDDQNGVVVNKDAAATVVNPLTGEAVNASGALDQIPVQPFGIIVAPDNFLEGIGLGGNAISDGFASIDPVAFFNFVAADDGTALQINNLETRSAEFENLALYGKANFEFLDGRLTGDIGLRYVETELSTTGFSGINAFSESFGRNQRVYDLRNLRALTNASLPACPDLPSNAGLPGGFQEVLGRVDGLGFDANGTVDRSDDTPLPNSAPCHDTFLVDPANLANQGFFPVSLRRYNNFFWTNNDIISTGFQQNPDGTFASGPANNVRDAASAGSHSYEVYLPNLNLNYLVNDEWIVRGAVSQTMTRPEIEQTRAGFIATETGWGNPATRTHRINLFNTQLEPLKSTNFDASVEWYFEDDALLSVGFFHKKLKDLLEVENAQVRLRDIKTEFQNGDEISVDGLILDDASVTAENCYAEIISEWQYGYNPAYVQEMIYGNDADTVCALFNASQPRNAASANITGVELQYSQNYTFLPGIFSGLGLTANYTYQDSKFGEDTSGLSGDALDRIQIPDTPKHSYNVTGFWQKDGHQLRLAYGGQSDSLVSRTSVNALGRIWREGRETLDFSGNYKVNDRVSFSFNASNLLDQPYRTYFTSTSVQLPEDPLGGGADLVNYVEGNPLDDGSVYKGRTVNEFNTGKTFRVAVRVDF